jgi:peptidyl-Lys metalloendopeptidase
MRKVLLGSLLLVCAFTGSAFAAQGGVSVHLDASAKAADIGSGKLVFTMVNDSATSVHVLRWQTPFDGVTSDLFSVARDGAAVDYVGPMYKRAAPQAKDYIELQPGAQRSVEVDLSAYYDMKMGGQYTITYARDAQSALLEAGQAARAGVAATTAIETDATTLWVDGGPDALDASDGGHTLQGGGSVLAATNSFVSCSNTRKTQLATARNSAVTYATNSKSYLDAGTQGSRYTWWFGTYNSSRYSTVRTHFTNLKSALSTQPYTFDCSCSDTGTYAYVYPTQPYRVYLCGAFWAAPNTGTDSRAGTLVHESSHFNVVASTDDWAYGQTAAHNLALSNPAHAIDNADSHEYFAENNPFRN